MWSNFVSYSLCLIVLLLFGGQLNALESNFVSSPSTPLSNVDTLAQAPLTEDNFTSVFPIVCIADGCIEGRATPGFQIDEYESFFAIPYAEPPVGKLRFAVRKSHNLSTYFIMNCCRMNGCSSLKVKHSCGFKRFVLHFHPDFWIPLKNIAFQL